MDGRVSNFAQVASLRRYTVSEGRAKGLDVIDCDNGKLRFLLNVDKALDVMQVYHEGSNVSFLSKNAFVKQETPFLRRFEGGMIYTCGLDNAGRREGYELHGRLHNTPAEIVHAVCDENGIVVEAIVRDTELFGKNLVLRRRIFSPIGADRIELEDTLINEGYSAAEYCLLYHINMGYPMLDEGTRIVADVRQVFATDDEAARKQTDMLKIGAPHAREAENCYYLKLGAPEISLINDRLAKRVAVSYSAETLPCFLMWKSMASGDYALGFEPCTSEIGSRLSMKTVESGERVCFRVCLRVSKTDGGDKK